MNKHIDRFGRSLATRIEAKLAADEAQEKARIAKTHTTPEYLRYESDEPYAPYYRPQNADEFAFAIRTVIFIFAILGFLLWLTLSYAAAEPANGFPPIKIVDSCATFAAIPRALANCENNEAFARDEALQHWNVTPETDQGSCRQLAASAPHNRYQVLDRCLRVAISEDEWKRK
jgi:hypothetical protein